MESEIQQVDGHIEDGGPVGETGSILERSVAFQLTATAAVAALALVGASLLRLPELARWALSPEEGEVALAAHNLVRGITLPDDMLGQPFVIEWVALFMFLGDTNESVGRVGLAVAGIIAIVAVLLLRPLLGARVSVAAALLLALSPTFVASSRFMEGGALTITLSLLLFAGLIASRKSESLIYPTLSGVALALLFLSGPIGLPAIILVIVGAYLTDEESWMPDRQQLTVAGSSFLIAFVLVSSALLTQPSSLYEAPAESLWILWDDHLVNVGDGIHLTLTNLLINEPLLLLLAITGFIWGREVPIVRGLGAWAVVSFVIVSLLGNAGAGGFGLAVLPIGLLAGFGAVGLVEKLAMTRSRLTWTAAYLGTLIVLAFAFISLLGLASPAEGRSGSDTAVRFLLIAVVVLVPAGVLLVRAGDRLEGVRIALVLAAAVILIGAVTVRSAVLTVIDWPGEPGDLLSVQVMGDDIPIVVDRMNRISRDLTRTERDARMPVGGIGLRISLDERVEQPFAWYFREYPNLITFNPSRESLPEGTQVAILAGSRNPEEAAPGLPGATYILEHDEPEYVADPDWGNLLGDLFALDGWRDFFSFMLNRETSEPVPASEFHLQAIPVIAERFAVSSGPYSLDDRAGIGSAGGQFDQPRGIAFDDLGGVYVIDGGNSRIQRFDAAGAFDRALAEGALAPFPSGAGGAGGLAIDEAGNLYVADTWNHQVKVFAPTGEQLRTWGTFFDAMDDPELVTGNPGEFYGPRDLVIHDGLLYVTDTGNERVQVFTLEGQFVRMFGQFGTGDGELIEPLGIAVTQDGIVLVADSHNARIARFTLEGEPLDPWPVDLWTGQQFFEPYLAVGPDGRVYASDSVSGQIAVFDQAGQPLAPLSDPSLLRPYDMAISSDGLQMLVSDGLANAIIRISITPGG